MAEGSNREMRLLLAAIMMLTVLNAFICMIHDNVFALFVAVSIWFQVMHGHCQGHLSCLPSLQVSYIDYNLQCVDDLTVKCSFAR